MLECQNIEYLPDGDSQALGPLDLIALFPASGKRQSIYSFSTLLRYLLLEAESPPR